MYGKCSWHPIFPFDYHVSLSFIAVEHSGLLFFFAAVEMRSQWLKLYSLRHSKSAVRNSRFSFDCIVCIFRILFPFHFVFFYSHRKFVRSLTSSTRSWYTNDCGNRNSLACESHCVHCSDLFSSVRPKFALQLMPDDGSASYFGWF